ncbi:MAG: alpha-amylase family glycosyl hydrolase [bacterium]
MKDSYSDVMVVKDRGEPILPIQHKWGLGAACGPTWLSPTTVHFRIWAPHGESVKIEFMTGRVVELARETSNPHFWSAKVDAVQSGDRYRVVLLSQWNDCYDLEGSELIRRDVYARETDFDSAWCVLTDPLFCWSDFRAPAYNELIIYELHVGSFPPQCVGKSVFQNAALQLSHIRDLGFNCIQLMPVTEFGGIWGYNPRQLLAVHGRWGTATQLKELIDQAHRIGLSVVIDVVLNHGSAKLNCLWNWDGFGPHKCGGIYFEGEHDTTWGKRFAFHKWEVKEYLKAACRMWIEEYNCDGLRFDSVHNMPWHMLQEMTYEIKHHYPGKILIAEVTPENPAVIMEAGFDSCWVHAAHFDSLKIMKRNNGGTNPYHRIAMLKAIIDMHWGFPSSCSGVNSVLGSHDQCGDRHNGREDNGIHRYYISRLGGRNNWHARAQIRMWYALQAMSRGLPMIFMGTETLQEEWWHVDEGHRFNWWFVDEHDLFATQMMRCVKDANSLRLGSCAFTSENIRFVHEDAEHTVLAWIRWADEHDPRKRRDKDEVYLCVANIGERQWERSDYGLHTGWGAGRVWKQIFNSQAEVYGGWDGSAPIGEFSSDHEERIWINLPKWSLLVFQLL